jgi:transposase
MGRQHHGPEFKREAVRQVVEVKRPKAQVARDLGIHVNVLKNWIKTFQADPEGAFDGTSGLSAERAEIERLRKELARVKAERDILKKAVACFAKDPT